MTVSERLSAPDCARSFRRARHPAHAGAEMVPIVVTIASMKRVWRWMMRGVVGLSLALCLGDNARRRADHKLGRRGAGVGGGAGNGAVADGGAAEFDAAMATAEAARGGVV